MTEEFLVPHRPTREMLLQKCPELLRIALLGFRRRLVRQRRFKLDQLAAGELAVEPRGPFFFKRFHRGPSGGFGVFSGRRKVATSPCRWNNRALPRSRGIACLRFPSSKLPPDVPPTAARLPDQSALAPRAAPFAGAAMARLAEQFSRKDRFLAAEHCHRIPSRFL